MTVFILYNVVSQLMLVLCVFFFQAEDGIRDLVRSRGLGDVYKRQVVPPVAGSAAAVLHRGPAGAARHAEGQDGGARRTLSLIHI